MSWHRSRHKLGHTPPWMQSIHPLFPCDFAPNSCFRTSKKPPLPITSWIQGPITSPSHSLSAAQGISQRESQGHPWLRQVPPTTLETQQASRRQTQSHWATIVSSWTPHSSQPGPGKNTQLKMFYLRQTKREEAVQVCSVGGSDGPVSAQNELAP